MELKEAIQHLQESLADPTHKWGCEECKAEHEQLLEWLEDYKQLKADYIDLDNKLRTENTEIDRLQSESSWIPCNKKMPFEPGVHVLATDGAHIMESWYEVIDGETLWVDNYTMYDNVNFGEVTHWMPLPKPPKE